MRWHPRDNSKWQRWFAWHPVDCRCGTFVWMETVWRREIYRGNPHVHEYAVFEERPDIIEDDVTPKGFL